ILLRSRRPLFDRLGGPLGRTSSSAGLCCPEGCASSYAGAGTRRHSHGGKCRYRADRGRVAFCRLGSSNHNERCFADASITALGAVMIRFLFCVAIAASAFPPITFAASPYVDDQSRSIKALSDQE